MLLQQGGVDPREIRAARYRDGCARTVGRECGAACAKI
jgi:hypothetical protein